MTARVDAAFWHGRNVLITGHTGFKGGWLSLWLQHLGAKVTGFALPASANPSLFDAARVAEGMCSIDGDIRRPGELHNVLQETAPEIVFHLAAQSLVRHSYRDPLATYETNVMGTVNVLEAIRASTSVRACVIVTSDKCYENKESLSGYRESDPMGGYDPYSSSKGCAELITAAYRQSFFNPAQYELHRMALASARAGNVIGGGDWAEDRLVPDIMRAFARGDKVCIRHPDAVRPWQHVLEPVGGYLVLAQHLYADGARHAEGWNFGPDETEVCTVRALTERLQMLWPDGEVSYGERASELHEAKLLTLDCSKAREALGWRSAWPLDSGLSATVSWYRAHRAGADMRAFTLTQIAGYGAGLREAASHR